MFSSLVLEVELCAAKCYVNRETLYLEILRDIIS